MSCNDIKRILCITNPIKYSDISIYNLSGENITNNCLFSWSTDGVCWTNYVDYNNYKNICSAISGDFFIRVLFSGLFDKIFIGSIQVDCYNIYLDNNRFELVDCNDNQFNFFDNINCAVQIQQQISDKIACLFGIPVYYFRVTPDVESKDLTFKEYTLHNVDSVKSVKLILQDGVLPSSKPQFTEFDFDWEMDWEVEISKTNFALAFGETAFPKQRDFIYIPMMKRMYEVNSAYDEKEGMLMWQSTTFKLGLIKWNEKNNIDYTGFEDVIDDWVENKYEDVFGLESLEQETQSETIQMRQPKFISNNIKLYYTDAIRHSASEMNIIDNQLNHKNVYIAKNAYLFNQPGIINYIDSICGENGAISFIIECPNFIINQQIIEFGEVKLWLSTEGKNYIISDSMKNSITLDANGTYIVNYIWNRQNFSIEFYVFKYRIIEKYSNVPSYKLKPEMYEFKFYASNTFLYNNDYIQLNKNNCSIFPGKFKFSNIKLYNKALTLEEIKTEMLKYSTKHENCIINDNVQPIETGFGSTPK